MAETTRAFLVAHLVALAFLFSEGDARAAAAESGWRSAQQRREVQSLLKRINKPPVKSIQSPDGDIIDCVHISKQPAFDHPLLKNHIIQMRPSIQPSGQVYDESNIGSITQTWHQNGECPEDTIPIRRTKEEDVMRASSVRMYGKKMPDWRRISKLVSMDNPLNDVTTGHEYGVAYGTGDNEYFGTKMTINVWQPTPQSGDFSLAQLWISAGSYGNQDLNTIEVGWQVYPAMYGDGSTRLFIYWTRDAYNRTGCYNLGCSGFVQTDTRFTIGGSLSPVSTYGGTQYELDILVWKDPNTHNWWLQVGGTNVGYWPSSIFTRLATSASSVEWGGEVYSPSMTTPMGSGHFPEEGFGKASYIRTIQVVDSSNQLKSPNGVGLIAGNPNFYNVKSGVSSDSWGTYIFFGGPGKTNSEIDVI
ncbi:unnamed protein product [Urochloa decumbens]|uniref:Neprosin PEP catalytic domain-containing protein n=1 Tax=Urochloa decumbens TaxID=240449 RepID=A0ABC9APR1_9POAL